MTWEGRKPAGLGLPAKLNLSRMLLSGIAGKWVFRSHWVEPCLEEAMEKTQHSINQPIGQSTCTRCSCGLDAGRTAKKTSRYCRTCAPVVRREQSAAWKRAFRSAFGWRKYHDEYSPFVDAEAERAHRREYMQQYRKRKRDGNGAAGSSIVLCQQAA
jgi:hypothetical protein